MDPTVLFSLKYGKIGTGVTDRDESGCWERQSLSDVND